MNHEERGALRRHIVDACVKAANNKGCCDAVGVLRGTLFLETGPMSLDRLVEETGYSKSTVSSNMNLLERFGLARRVVIPGDKRYHYVPVTDPDSLRKAMLVNIKSEIQMILTALDQTEKEIRDSEQDLDEVLKRIESIRHFYRQIERLLNLLVRHTTEELIEILENADKMLNENVL